MGSVPLTGWLALGLGLIVGSFLNVCIWRLPRGLSVVSPPSACPACGERIRWYDNVPLFSFLLLRGRCRCCRGRIPWHYPLVELTTGLLFLAIVARPFPPAVLVCQCCWVSLLIVVTVIDLRHGIIPDVITLPGIVMAFTARALAGESLVEGAWGLLVGGGSLFLVGWAYERFTRIEGMGAGDVKLMAMVGAFLGWQGAFAVIFVGSLAGGIAGVFLLAMGRAGRRTPLPFGSFLAPTAVVVLLAGSSLARFYLGIVR